MCVDSVQIVCVFVRKTKDVMIECDMIGKGRDI